MAGRDTDMRSWADLLHNSSQLLHSYTPSAPLPPIQVHFHLSAVIVWKPPRCGYIGVRIFLSKIGSIVETCSDLNTFNVSFSSLSSNLSHNFVSEVCFQIAVVP